MGQEQSAEGGSGSFSLLKGMRSKGDGIVVVRAGDTEPKDPTKELDYLKLQDIPTFFPILRSQLAIPGVKDPPDLFTKLEPGPTLALAARLSIHFQSCSEMVATEQGSLTTRIREIDYAIATMANRLREREKLANRQITNELTKTRELSSGLKKITASLTAVVPLLQAANAALPEDLRLSEMDFASILNPPSTFVPESIDEQAVIDSA